MKKYLFYGFVGSLITVGALLAVWLFLIFTNKPTVELIFGLLGGISLSFLLYYLIQKIIGLRELKESNTVQFYEQLGQKLNSWIGISDEKKQGLATGSRITLIFKGLITSWAMFGMFAVIGSMALFYATLLQVNKLETQNTIINEQNYLICQQNQFLDRANKFSDYNLEITRIDLSKNSLQEIIVEADAAYSSTSKCVNIRYYDDEFLNCIFNIENSMYGPIGEFLSNSSRAYSILPKPTDKFSNLDDSFESYFTKYKEIKAEVESKIDELKTGINLTEDIDISGLLLNDVQARLKTYLYNLDGLNTKMKSDLEVLNKGAGSARTVFDSANVTCSKKQINSD